MTARRATRLTTVAQSIAAGAVTITLLTVAVRILGLVRWGTQAGQVGSVGIAEAYSSANLIPNVLFEVVAGGALAGAIVPLLAGPIVAKAARQVNTTSAALLTWTVLVLSAVGLATALLAPQIVGAIPRVNEPELADTAAYFLRVFAVQLPLYGVSVVLTGILQAHRRFLWPAMAPAFSSLVVIGTYVAFGHLAHGTQTSPGSVPDGAVQLLAWGTTAGVAALSLPLFLPVRKLGVSLRPTLRMPSGQARSFAALAGAGVAGLIAQQIAIVITMLAVNDLADAGAYPVWQYAQAVAMVIFGVLAVPIATASFPVLSQLHSQQNRTGVQQTASSVWRVLVIVTIAGTATVLCIAQPIEAFFGFTHGGVTAMSQAVIWLAVSLIPMSLSFFLARLLYAVHRARAGALGTVMGWGTAALLTLVLMATNTQLGTAAAFTRIGMAMVLGLSIGLIALVIAVGRVLGYRTFTDAVPAAAMTTILAIGLAALCHVVVPSADSLSVAQGLLWVIMIGVPVFAVIVVSGLWRERTSVRSLLSPTVQRQEQP
ncbi:putative peptidoglycan lipid II flippase [Micrococcales bacterium KH10]|nr:putative peptidoglycan lipid II flippase [Micrococcales bacterium KH10]